ncbi:MAG: UDP-glucose/GDP-mannose dehydrogenase family protein [Phycisphaerae bacterium]|nr:UDP-glucose/GDP-mannose dehydrogenase family protein [Gemmatimonadaceae bacterium]
MARVSVFGLGYVGCVSAGCLAKEGHEVVGVDVAAEKVELINRGTATIVEEGVQELIASMVTGGRLRATTDVRRAIAETEVSLVCVGTPSRANGGLNLEYVERVCSEIGEAILAKGAMHTVVIRSTVLPGTVHDLVIPALEKASGLKSGVGFHVCANPEFLREGTSIHDFYDPPFTVIGSESEEGAQAVRDLYGGLNAPVFVVPVRVSEMVKYTCNAFHGLKVAFANEIGNICAAQGIDSHEVMRIVCEDRKLNISAAYLRPGFAFGGSCLPKDLRAVTFRARELDVETPLLRSVLESNALQVERAYRLIVDSGRRKVGVLGLAFKPGTDDLRESPLVALVERLIGRGFEVRVYDRYVREAKITGANRTFIEKEIPHIWTLMAESADEVVDSCDVLVLGTDIARSVVLSDVRIRDKAIVDLVRVRDRVVESAPGYRGITW